MKINHLKISNFRGIESLNIECHDRLNVFIGENGAGKSSVLNCLAILLSQLTRRIVSESSKGRLFTESDVRRDTNATASTVSVSLLEEQYSWTAGKSILRKKGPTLSNQDNIKGIVSMINEQLDKNKDFAMPLVAFYPTNRAVFNVPLRISKQHTFDQIAALDQSLSEKGERADFKLFFEWFRNREDIENENFKKSFLQKQDIKLLENSNIEALQSEQFKKSVEKIKTFMDGFKALGNSINAALQSEQFKEGVEKIKPFIDGLMALRTELIEGQIPNVSPKQTILVENREVIENETHEDKQLKAVRTAIESLLPSFSKLQVKRKPTLRMVVMKEDQEFRIEDLSDGEKCLLALVADMARRLAMANPALENPLEGEAVFLIDEIELHLHPSWQKMIVPKLLEVFPKSQFFLSTHSPLVLSEIKTPDSVWVMEAGEEPYHPKTTFGFDSNEILEIVMGTKSKPDELYEWLGKIDELINDDKFDEARQAIRDLAIASNGSIPALHGANAMLTMLGEEQVDL